MPKSENTALAKLAHPPITREHREVALLRLAMQREKFVTVYFSDNVVRIATGVIDMRDLIAESGYPVRLSGYDRFGWPVGHPDSPASQPFDSTQP